MEKNHSNLLLKFFIRSLIHNFILYTDVRYDTWTTSSRNRGTSILTEAERTAIENVVPISTSNSVFTPIFHPPPPPPPSHSSSLSLPSAQVPPYISVSAPSLSPSYSLSQKIGHTGALNDNEEENEFKFISNNNVLPLINTSINNQINNNNITDYSSMSNSQMKELNYEIPKGGLVELDRDTKSIENDFIGKVAPETKKMAKPGFLDAIKGMNMSNLR